MVQSRTIIWLLFIFLLASCQPETPILTKGKPGQLFITKISETALRFTLKPNSLDELPYNPAFTEEGLPEPIWQLSNLNGVVEKKIGAMKIKVSNEPLVISIFDLNHRLIQTLTFHDDGTLNFQSDGSPILGLGEGGPQPERGVNWHEQPVEYDRTGRFHAMQPRWQANAYGSRNPVPLLLGTEGWGLFSAAPWVEVDLTIEGEGTLIPWQAAGDTSPQTRVNQQENRGKGRPPLNAQVEGLWDLFVFDTSQPLKTMQDLSVISGAAVIPPKWSMGYMQSHRTLRDEDEMLEIVDSFRKKRIPLDAVIYLGTEFCPKGWNEYQPSFEFNDDLFERNPEDVIEDLHDRNVKVVAHMVPYDRDKLPTLHGSIPPKAGEIIDASHIHTYWQPHGSLMQSGIDAYWPDEGDWFDLHERIKRHQLYYQGPISTFPNQRPWSLHRNGYLGIAKWGGWVWSGDTQSAWKTLEAQIAVGINHSLSISPFWGSDIGGFYPNAEKTGDLYARWFQFGAFNPSFRSHGRTWHTALPWGFGLEDMGIREPNRTNDMGEPGAELRAPLKSSMNDKRIEPISKQYAELRYQLMPYNYTLTWLARSTGVPPMRALWLHYPKDDQAKGIGDQFMWGDNLLIAPVYKKDATSRPVYLPEGKWYDWWTHDVQVGKTMIDRSIDLATMPIYVKEGSIIPFDPIRQYSSELVNLPMTIKIFRGIDGEYTLYEDDGKSLDYLKGIYTLTDFNWNEGEQSLSINTKRNETGLTQRELIIELLPEGTKKRISYNYTNLVVSFR